MSKKALCLHGLALALLLGGCGGGRSSNTESVSSPPSAVDVSEEFRAARLVGMVTDAEGRPLAGATVEWVGGAKTPAATDENGAFAIPLSGRLKEGQRIALKTAKGGYVDAHNVVPVSQSALNGRDLFAPITLVRAASDALSAAAVRLVRADEANQGIKL